MAEELSPLETTLAVIAAALLVVTIAGLVFPT